jgi:putative SOS response-associated peptidase YedK
MCGRFTLKTRPDELHKLLLMLFDNIPPLEPRFNIAPTQNVLAVRLQTGATEGSRHKAALARQFWAAQALQTDPCQLPHARPAILRSGMGAKLPCPHRR